MRSVWFAGIAGAVGGGLVSWLVASTSTGRREPSELSAVLGELRDDILLLRKSLEDDPPRRLVLSSPVQSLEPAPVSRATDAPPASGQSPEPRPTAPSTTAAPIDRAGLGSPDRDAVSALRSWRQETNPNVDFEAARAKGIRRRWLFSTQEEVLAAFGTPDEISGSADEELWHYWQYEGRTRTSDIYLKFWNGRLRRVD